MVCTERAPRRQQFHAEPAMSTTKQFCNHFGEYSKLAVQSYSHSFRVAYDKSAVNMSLNSVRLQLRTQIWCYKHGLCSYKYLQLQNWKCDSDCQWRLSVATVSGICRLCVHLSSGLITAVDTVPVLKGMWMHWLLQTLLVLFSTFSSSNIPKMVFDFQFAFWLEIRIM